MDDIFITAMSLFLSHFIVLTQNCIGTINTIYKFCIDID